MLNTEPTPNTSTISKTVPRLPQVVRKIGLSRSTIYAHIKKHQFPAPFPLSGRSVGWLKGAVDARVDIRDGRYPAGVKLSPRCTGWRVADIRGVLDGVRVWS